MGSLRVAHRSSEDVDVTSRSTAKPWSVQSDLLSWDSLVPLHRVRLRASTPGRDVAAASFGFEQPARSPVPSSRFCASSTVCSARSSRACCIPLPISTCPPTCIGFRGLGFAAFHVPGSRRLAAWILRDDSRCAEFPSKDSPHRQPRHVTMVVAPLPLSAPYAAISSRDCVDPPKRR